MAATPGEMGERSIPQTMPNSHIPTPTSSRTQRQFRTRGTWILQIRLAWPLPPPSWSESHGLGILAVSRTRAIVGCLAFAILPEAGLLVPALQEADHVKWVEESLQERPFVLVPRPGDLRRPVSCKIPRAPKSAISLGKLFGSRKTMRSGGLDGCTRSAPELGYAHVFALLGRYRRGCRIFITLACSVSNYPSRMVLDSITIRGHMSREAFLSPYPLDMGQGCRLWLGVSHVQTELLSMSVASKT